MKRSELQVGDAVVTNVYGSIATVADLAAWEKSTGWSLGFRITEDQYRAALADPVEAGFAGVSASRDGLMFKANLRRRLEGGSTVLVQRQTAHGEPRYDVASLAAIRLLDDVEAEQALKIAAQRAIEERLRADLELIDELPRELRADRALTYGHAGNVSRIQPGRVTVDLEVLRILIDCPEEA